MDHPSILVVEDESIVAMDIRRALVELGYEVVGVVATGGDAIEHARRLKPNLVLMDIHLQGTMDGIEAGQYITEQFALPVVYLTAYSDTDTVTRARQTDPFGYVLKPFEERELDMAIQMALYRHSMEVQLRQAKSRLAATLRSIGVGVVAVDENGDVTLLNQDAERMLGCIETAVTGLPLARICDIVPPPVQQSEGRHLEAMAITAIGVEFPIEYSMSRIIGEKGKVLGRVFAFKDIRARQAAEAELIATRNQAQEANQAKSMFLARMSHELRTPLNAIIGFSSVILDQCDPLPVPTREYLGHISQAGQNLLVLVNDLLDLARIEAGRLELYPTLLDLSAEVDSVLALLSPLAQAKTLALERPTSPLGPLQADRARLRQMLINLLSNAIKFTPAGGEVGLVVERDLDEVRIIVYDNGPGIAAADQQRIFESFEQTTGADQTQGSGLGLSIARHLARAHGGRLTVDSIPGRGSKFILTIPQPLASGGGAG